MISANTLRLRQMKHNASRKRWKKHLSTHPDDCEHSRILAGLEREKIKKEIKAVAERAKRRADGKVKDRPGIMKRLFRRVTGK